jgi:hypothetical protein
MPDDLKPPPDPRKTLLRAFGVLAMLGIAISGMAYSIWVIWSARH